MDFLSDSRGAFCVECIPEYSKKDPKGPRPNLIRAICMK